MTCIAAMPPDVPQAGRFPAAPRRSVCMHMTLHVLSTISTFEPDVPTDVKVLQGRKCLARVAPS